MTQSDRQDRRRARERLTEDRPVTFDKLPDAMTEPKTTRDSAG